MYLPEYVVEAIGRLESGGYEAYVVGGCLRDSLLGLVPKDYDIATSALPEDTARLFRDCTTITAGQKHGTVAPVIDGRVVEITTYRTEGGYSDHRRPDSVSFACGVTDDLSRRDFTVNAMAYSPRHGFVDPFGGVADLHSGILRAVGDPAVRFSEDALRILRGVRFASVYGLEPEDATAEAMFACAPPLAEISAERVREELFGAINGRYAEKCIYKFREVYRPVLPELAVMADRPDAFSGDLLKKSLSVMSRVGGETWLKLAALFEKVDPGGWAASANAACAILNRLKTDRRTRENTAILIREPGLTVFSRAELRRLISRLTPLRATAFLALRHASAEMAGGGDEAEEYGRALELADEILRSGECVSREALELSGDDLAALGVPPGRKMGRLLETLFGEVLDGRLENAKPVLAARALELISLGDGGYVGGI